MIRRFERFSYAIAEISKNWRKLAAEEMEKYALKGPHCTYLLALSESADGLTAPQLCEVCGKDKSDVSRMMKILEDKKLVYKTGEYQNRYGGIFKLSDMGQSAAYEVRKKVSRAVEIAGGDLTKEQRDTFYYALDSIVTRLRELSEGGIPSE